MVKQEVLKLLEQNRGVTFSGQDLADQLGVSRTAVWKAIQALRKEGYQIQAATNKGYQLDLNSDKLSAEGMRTFLEPEWKDSLIIDCDLLDSTNYYAKKLALEGREQVAVVLANEQTNGRGRMGRSFFSPPHTGLYMSLLLRPGYSIAYSSMITVAAAVAVCCAVENLTDFRPQIKWVNDIFWQGKKICGILTEAVSDFESGMVESLVIGIGINISTKTESFPPDLQAIAGSLFPIRLSRNQLAAEIANQLLNRQENLNDPQLIQEYKKRSLLLDQEICYEQSGRIYRGRVRDINKKGHLVIRDTAGRTKILSSGEVSWG